MVKALIVGLLIITNAGAASQLLHTRSNFPSIAPDNSFLYRNVGAGDCETGASIYHDGNTCQLPAAVCTVLTTDITVPLINLVLHLPTGCDHNDIDKPLCPGDVQWRTLGSGTVKKVEPKSCGDLKEYNLCKEVPHGPFCTNIGAGHQDWVDDIIDYFEDYYGNSVIDVNYNNTSGQLCLTADGLFKKCEKHSPGPYSCGSHYAEVTECTQSYPPPTP